MATVEKMTVHRALCELKTIDARISSAIESVPYVMAVKHSAEKVNGMTIPELKDSIKSGYQKVTDLIARRNAMKQAVVMSNANTEVKIGDMTMTVATAIDYKNNAIGYKRALVNRINLYYAKAQGDLERNSGEAIEKRAEQYVLSVIQAQPKESKMTADSDAMQALRKQYIENNQYDLVDPLNAVKIMETIKNEIDEFETEIDAALSTSNALTVIEFSY